MNGKGSTDKFSVAGMLGEIFPPQIAQGIADVGSMIPGVGLAENGVDALGAIYDHLKNKASSTTMAPASQATSTQVASQGSVQNYGNEASGGSSSGVQNNVSSSSYRRRRSNSNSYTADR